MDTILSENLAINVFVRPAVDMQVITNPDDPDFCIMLMLEALAFLKDCEALFKTMKQPSKWYGDGLLSPPSETVSSVP